LPLHFIYFIMQTTEVLIAGAGPTGLVLALWLTKSGVKVRIIDKAAHAGATSRALVFHARNLEFYHQMGFAEEAVAKGIEIKGVNLWKRGKKVGHAAFDNLQMKISPYQYVLGLAQDVQEQILGDQLATAGIMIEWQTELLSFEQTDNGISAVLQKANGEQETCTALYLAGCDGAHSVVRKQLGAEFPGGTYEETFYVADLLCKGEFIGGEINIALDGTDFLAIFPIKGDNEVRLVGTIRPEAMKKPDLQWGDVSDEVIKQLQIEVAQVKWFSTYKVHHRVAAHFHQGRAFLLGDAGHLHSPIGGQGMNTGIGDAVNLAWKLAAVIKDKAPTAILDTYEPERIAFARRLVASTDLAFTFVTKRSRLATWIRMNIIPAIVPRLFGFVAMRRLLFRTISQLAINYRHSALSTGTEGKAKAGDRLPWVPMNGTDNFAGLTSMKWQVHVYGSAPDWLKNICTQKGVQLHIFEWTEAAKKAGLNKNSLYVIRPDGYIGMANRNADIQKITAYMDQWGIRY